jgi:zinc transport system ATP-binding protein
MPALIEIRQVSYSYGPSPSVAPALEDVTLDVEAGSTLGIIGPNGGGKTTLLQLLLGRLEPQRGRILVDSLSPARAVRKGNLLGYLPQATASRGPERNALPITVRQTVQLGLAGKTGLLNPTPKEDLEFADHLLAKVGLHDRAHVPISSLSGGQLQRAYIARALVARPRILLLDEPTTGIDRASQERLLDLLAELKQQLGLTVILVSHDLRAVTSTCDRIACLDRTLHYHDVPASFPEQLAREKFCCDLEAMGLPHGHGNYASAPHHTPHPVAGPVPVVDVPVSFRFGGN